MTSSLVSPRLALFSTFGIALIASVHGAVSVPYDDDFSSYGAAASSNASANSISRFTENNIAAFAVYSRVGGDASSNFLRGNIQAISTGTAVIRPNNAEGGNDFTVSTLARASTLNAGAEVGGGPATSLNFSLIGATSLTNINADPSASGISTITGGYYSITIDYRAETISLTKSGTSIGSAIGSSAPSWFTTSATPLSFTLTGVYHSGGIDLTGTITDGTHTYTVTATDDTPLTGSYFGYQLNKNGNTNSTNGTQSQLTVQMDDFYLNVVPEPSAVLLTASGIFAFSMRRRRSR